MECFRQIFQCFKAPFTRSEERVIEISRPTNFRKEELPVCFSDAESVISPSQNTAERPILTSQPQHVDVSEQPRSDDGQERSDYRNGDAFAVSRVGNPESYSEDEHQHATIRLRDRMNPSRWFKSTPATDPEIEVMEEDKLVTTAGKE
ncbi:uncharacterized protein N7459_002887 [Penicillium hispanicum]|uniref:uncharacterized protein n=1 Tax=Penicillium hispanicum TaxID=1080232 RepID=UPI002542030A|nr:uncharacterized protein N7459_002887 [Penicillium hispanicum]KAJ5587122.1 hypothetical protein N7459_002887 [Penicillium hispanicum]